MQKQNMPALLLACSLALCGCARSGKDVKPVSEVCPKPPKPPAALMILPTYELQAQRILFESVPNVTQESERGSPTPEP